GHEQRGREDEEQLRGGDGALDRVHEVLCNAKYMSSQGSSEWNFDSALRGGEEIERVNRGLAGGPSSSFTAPPTQPLPRFRRLMMTREREATRTSYLIPRTLLSAPASVRRTCPSPVEAWHATSARGTPCALTSTARS